jgi:guanylate kinase
MTSLFITTPNQNILKQRLISRDTDTLNVIEERLINAKQEMKRIDEYDYLLINDDFEKAFDQFDSIVKVSKMKQLQFSW